MAAPRHNLAYAAGMAFNFSAIQLDSSSVQFVEEHRGMLISRHGAAASSLRQRLMTR
jgi:hypothetical protein